MQASLLLSGSCLLSELFRTLIVPCHYLRIWFQGKCFRWKVFREALPGIRVLNIEVVDRKLDERHMLLRP
jgi:hypothetical protein